MRKLNDINGIVNKQSKYDFGQLFNVYNHDNTHNSFSINKTLNLSNIPIANNDDAMPSPFFKYRVQQYDTWTNISYKMYGNIELWWLICKLNNVTNPVEMPYTNFKYLTMIEETYIDEIINSLRNG